MCMIVLKLAWYSDGKFGHDKCTSELDQIRVNSKLGGSTRGTHVKNDSSGSFVRRKRNPPLAAVQAGKAKAVSGSNIRTQHAARDSVSVQFE